MGVSWRMLRSLEHHVLEPVSKSRAPWMLSGRPDVIPNVRRYERKAMILGENHDEAIGQRVLFELDAWGCAGGRRCRLSERGLGRSLLRRRRIRLVPGWVLAGQDHGCYGKEETYS